MSRKREVVNINGREYTIKEMTVEEIINIVENSIVFSSQKTNNPETESEEKKSEKVSASLVGEIGSIFVDFGKVIDTCCDFTIEDMKKMAPSEIKLLHEAFKKANSDFFVLLTAIGVPEILTSIKEAVVIRCSKVLATLLNLAI